MKMKGILAAVLCSVLLLGACSGSDRPSRAEKVSAANSASSAQGSVPTTDSSVPDEPSATNESLAQDSSQASEGSQLPGVFPEPKCFASLLYCVEDDKVLYTDSADLPTAPASITKLVTASVVLKYMKPDDIVEVGTELNLVDPESSICYINIGNRLTVHDLLTGMLLCSGNDAAYTAAVNTARAVHSGEELSDQEAVSVFVDMMNETAAEMGMSHSHFMTPDGWDNSEQHVTANDLVLLAKYVLSVPELRTIVGTYEKSVEFVSGETLDWTNSNQLLNPKSVFYCPDAIGLKTGTTDYAGACLLSAFEKDNKTYIAAALGCENNSDRYQLTLLLYDLIK